MSFPEPPAPREEPLDRALAAAFARLGAGSVLGTLSQRTRSILGLHLPPAEGVGSPALCVADRAVADSLRSPRYQVLGEIARGGVGLVYHARDVDLGRDVAMKVLRSEYQDHPEIVQRFVEEAQIGGQLQHPGIVPVYEFGLQQGDQPFFAMKLIQGQTLASQLNSRSAPKEDRRRFLGVFEQVCQTIAYAHARRVVHRDLKPSNVMIGAFGEVQVVDWGFAKVLSAGGVEDERRSASRAPRDERVETVRTQPGSKHSIAGSVFGTPEYMPPEQARGEVHLMDERSDVFSLGAVLCEILTGLPPYAAVEGDLLELARTADTSHALARLERCGAAHELRALAAQCLSVDPSARPASARQVAERVSGYLTAAEERARAAQSRLRTTLAVGATVLVALALGGYALESSRGAADERRNRATALVVDALQETQTARGRALERGNDVLTWQAALHAAQKASALAAAPDVPPDLAQSASSTLGEIATAADAAERVREQAARDEAMVARLVELRLPPDDNLDRRDWPLDEAVRLAKAYSSAFSEYGLGIAGDPSVETPGVEQLADRAIAIALPLAAALDHWGVELRRLVLLESRDLLDAPRRARLLEEARHKHSLAATLDSGDEWRDRLHRALADEKLDQDTLRELAASAPIDEQPVLSLLTLADALALLDELGDAVAFLRRVQIAHPGDFVLALRLGVMLESQGPQVADEAFALYRIAHALRPDMRETRHRQGHALAAAGELESAARIYEQLAAEDPRYQWFHHAGVARDNMDAETNRRGAGSGQEPAAARLFRSALECAPEPWDPERRSVRYGLARILLRTGELDSAIEMLRAIVVEDPEHSGAHFSLGSALFMKAEQRPLPAGRALLADPLVSEALACYRRSLELDPDQIDGHYNIGNILYEAGDYEGAVEQHRLEAERHPNHVGAHNNMGNALSVAGRTEEAAASYRRTVELSPDYAVAWNNLSSVLSRLGRYAEAVEAGRSAVRLGPEYANAHGNLALALWNSGEWREAVDLWERALELNPEEGARAYFAKSLAQAREQFAKSQRWSELLSGALALREASAAELCEAADFGYMRRLHRAAARLWAEALRRDAGDGSLPPSNYYDAACSAALAACGASADAGELDAGERRELRDSALEWLQVRLARWRENPDRAAARFALERWLADSDLASVRDLSALSSFSSEEAERWSGLWGEVVATLAALRAGQ